MLKKRFLISQSIGQIEDISFYVNLLNPVPGEDRLVNQKLEVYYTDVNGNPVMTELDPQYVHVLNSAFEGSISTDKPEYQPNENAVISLSIKSLSEYAKTIDAKVLVEDGSGALIKEVAVITALNFSAGETKNFDNLVFNTGSINAGNYRVHLILYDNQKQTAEAFADFAVLPVKAGTSSVITDKVAYRANEPVTITSQIRNTSLNYAFRNLTGKISLFDNQGRLLFTDSKTIPAITPGGLTSFNTFWNTSINPKGKYTVTLDVFEDASAVSTSQTMFDILGTSQIAAGIVGTIVAQPDFVYQGKSETLTYSIKNVGNEDLTDLVVKVIVVDPDNGEIKHTFESIVNLNMAATISGQSVASTSNMSPKAYVVLLQASTTVMKQKTLSTATFVVKSSPLSGSIEGIISAGPDPVFQGEDEILSCRITNTGNEDITNLKVEVPVIDPDTQEVTATFEALVDVQANTTITGNFTFLTTDVTPKTYIAELRVSVTEMRQKRTLSSTTFEVRASLETTKTIPDSKRVLVWLNYPWQSGQDCPDRSIIERALKDAGVTYRIVLDKKDFNNELRNPWYTDIMILGTHNPIEDHISEELREHVYGGTGLLASMFYRQNLNEEVFGINYINSMSGRDYPIELASCEIWGEGSFQSYGRALDVEAADMSDVAGWVKEISNKGTIRHPGIIAHTFGLGNVLYYAFDLGMSTADYNSFAALLGASLHYIHGTERSDSLLSSRMVPVEIKVKSLGSAFDVRITETYPFEIKLYDPATVQWVTSNPWVSDVHIGPNETATMLYYALMPDIPGNYEFKTSIEYLDGGVYRHYQDLYAYIDVEKSSAAINGDIIAALQTMLVTGQDEVKVANAIKSLQDVMSRQIATRTDTEQNIRDILKAVDSLRAVNGTDISAVLLMIGDLLEVWESRWYFY